MNFMMVNMKRGNVRMLTKKQETRHLLPQKHLQPQEEHHKEIALKIADSVEDVIQILPLPSPLFLPRTMFNNKEFKYETTPPMGDVTNLIKMINKILDIDDDVFFYNLIKNNSSENEKSEKHMVIEEIQILEEPIPIPIPIVSEMPPKKICFDRNKIKKIQNESLSNTKEITHNDLLHKMNSMVKKVYTKLETEISKDVINYATMFTNENSKNNITNIICLMILDKLDKLIT